MHDDFNAYSSSCAVSAQSCSQVALMALKRCVESPRHVVKLMIKWLTFLGLSARSGRLFVKQALLIAVWLFTPLVQAGPSCRTAVSVAVPLVETSIFNELLAFDLRLRKPGSKVQQASSELWPKNIRRNCEKRLRWGSRLPCSGRP